MAINASSYLIFINTVTPVTALRGNPAYYRPVVCGKGNGFNMSVESISVRNKCDGGWDNSRPGYGNWGLDVDGFATGVKQSEKELKANFQELAILMMKKKRFWAVMCDLDKTIVREGVVWISSFDESANNNEAYSFSATFVGTGEPIMETSLFTTLLATDMTGTELVQDGNANLIDVKAELPVTEPTGVTPEPETGNDNWNDNGTWGG